jgi:hypothetical protein
MKGEQMRKHEGITWALHVDDKGKALCQISYDEQTIFIPIELMSDFSTKLKVWSDLVYPDESLDVQELCSRSTFLNSGADPSGISKGDYT